LRDLYDSVFLCFLFFSKVLQAGSIWRCSVPLVAKLGLSQRDQKAALEEGHIIAQHAPAVDTNGDNAAFGTACCIYAQSQ
jgi:hypothetical protein